MDLCQMEAISEAGAPAVPSKGAGRMITFKKKRQNHNRQKPKGWLTALVIALIFALALTAAIGVCQTLRQDTVVKTDSDAAVLGKGFSDIPIADEGTAIIAASYAAEQLGYENALSELSGFISTTVGDECYYRLQQNYQGIPVYGRYVIVTASDSGEALGLISYARDIPDSISLEQEIDDRQAAEAIAEYARFNWDALYDNIAVSSLSESPLVIYDQGAQPRLAHCLTVTNGDQYEVLVDAQTAQVLCSTRMVTSAGSEDNTDGHFANDESETFPVVKSESSDGTDTEYLLGTIREHGIITILNLHSTSSEKWSNSDNAKNVKSVGNEIFGELDDAEQGEDLRKAVDLLNNMIGITEFYQDNFGQEIPFGSLGAMINDSRDEGKNAFGGRDNHNRSVIYVGMELSCNETDILAHEYTHCVQSAHDAVIGGLSDEIAFSESAVLCEGLADTFSFFYNGYESDNWEMDMSVLFGFKFWNRNVKSPGIGYAKTIYDNVGGDDFKYMYATVISHAAYKMRESGCFEKDELMLLWYKTMISLPRQCSLSNFRDCMEHVADICEYTDSQKQVIADVLDYAGITDTYGKDLKIHVYDNWGNPYNHYEISISGKTEPLLPWFSESVEKTYEAAEDGPTAITLERGTYEVRITDLATGNEESRVIQVRTKSNAADLAFHGFAAEYTAAPGAQLTVLNEAGEICTDYHAFALVDGELVQLTDGVIDLPAQDCYQILLSHKTEFGHLQDTFRVWIKSNASDTLTRETDFRCDIPVEDDEPADDPQPPSTGDPNDPLPVTDAYTDAFEMDDGGIRCYHIPRIDLPTCEFFNYDLYSTYFSQLDHASYRAISCGEYPFVDNMSYMAGQKGDVISLVIHTAGWSSSYAVHNVSAVTGAEVSAAEVLALYGIPEDRFLERVAAVLDQSWTATCQYMIENMEPAAWEQIKAQTLSEQNIAAAVPFVGPGGRLCFIGNLFMAAGDGVITYLYDTASGQVLEWTNCGEDHSDIMRWQSLGPDIRITQEQAYQRAYSFWGIDPDEIKNETNPEYYVVMQDTIEEHQYIKYYVFYLRQSASENGSSWANTLDIVYVNAVTGTCTYSPDD